MITGDQASIGVGIAFEVSAGKIALVARITLVRLTNNAVPGMPLANLLAESALKKTYADYCKTVARHFSQVGETFAPRHSAISMLRVRRSLLPPSATTARAWSVGFPPAVAGAPYAVSLTAPGKDYSSRAYSLRRSSVVVFKKNARGKTPRASSKLKTGYANSAQPGVMLATSLVRNAGHRLARGRRSGFGRYVGERHDTH